jgi:hypothetical protein
MAGDNVRLNKALENIAHELKQTNRILEQIKNRLPRQTMLRFNNIPQEDLDGTTDSSAGETATDEVRSRLYGTGTTFPYT